MTTGQASSTPEQRIENTGILWMRMAQAENALYALTSGQIDAIMDPSGKAYLLAPAAEFGKLHTVIESTPDVITDVNRGGKILSQCQALNRVLGYEPKDLVGISIFELIHKDDVQRLTSAFFDVIEGAHERATAQFRHLTRDGGWRMIEATVEKVRDASAMGAVLGLRPIQSDRMEPKNETDVRNEDEKACELDELQRVESVDAHEVACSVVDLCEREIARAQVEVSLNLRAESHTLQTNWPRLLKLMCCVVRSAIEFSIPGSRIRITSANDVSGRLTFEVADNGVAPATSQIPPAHESFHEGEDSPQQSRSGFRDGLDIARRLTELLGGTLLTASGNGHEKGATTLLTLNTAPLAEADPVVAVPSSALANLHQKSLNITQP